MAVLKWGTWGVWFHNKQTLNHKEETKQNITEATSPTVPWMEPQAARAKSKPSQGS